MRNPALGFAPGIALAGTALGLGPVGWVALGLATAIPFLFMRSPRGEYQKFEREVYPTLASASRATGIETMTGWFNELVGTDVDGNRKVFGSWLGAGPEWGDAAAAKVMELARENFVWSFQSGRAAGPWVLIGPHPELGSVVYDVFASLASAVDYFERSRQRLLEQFEAGNPHPADPIEPTQEPIDPGEVAAPPDPAQPIDPPAPPPQYPPPAPRAPSIWKTAGGILGGVLGGIFGGSGGAGSRPPGAGSRPPGAGPGGGWLGTGEDDWMLWGAAALLVFAATRRKKGGNMPRGRPKKIIEAADPPETSYETIREFYRRRAADDSYVTVLRYTETGTLEFCCQGSPSAVDEAFVQERFGGGKFCFRLKTPDGSYLAQSTIAIAAPPEGAAASVLADGGGVDPMRAQFDLMRDQLARQQEMVIHLIDKQSTPGGQNDLVKVIEAVAALRTFADPGAQIKNVVSALTEGMRLGMKQTNGGGAPGGAEDKVNGVLRVVEKVSEMFPKLFGPRAGPGGPAPPDGSAAGSAAMMPDGAPRQPDPAAVLRGTINYLKTKITKDPALWAEMILDNVEESHWMFVAQLIEKPYDEIAETIGDPDLKREPFKSWFTKLWAELKLAYQSNLDTERPAGTEAVLQAMSDLVRASARDELVRETALDLVRNTYATSYDDFVYGLKSFFLRHVRWIDEPDELIAPPVRMLRAIRESGAVWGDCDDGAVLAASLFYSIGFSVRFRAVLEAEDGSFQHVFTEYKAPNSALWKIFDPTINFAPRFDSSLVMEV